MVGTESPNVDTIFILEVKSKDQPCLAAPEELFVEPGNQVKFKNTLAQSNAKIKFTDQGLFGQPELDLNPNEEITLTVHEVDVAAYPFDLYCNGIDAYPDKVARPRIIVYKR
ncbi:MAG: hypothetical protein KAT58_08050 [candidate division Zixibacteria bacterium]|nr:hypothetical protein [candidate division Zixibacteria bacterium]